MNRLIFLTLCSALLLAAPLTALGQDAPKLSTQIITMFARGDGYFNANVNLTLNRPHNEPAASFTLSFVKVRSSDEVEHSIPDAMRDLAKELDEASSTYHPAH